MKELPSLLYAYALARYFDILSLVKRRPLILFFRDGGIGDILCTFPAAAEIVRQHPEAYPVYCTNPSFVSIPIAVRLFNRVIGIKANDLVASKVSSRHKVYRLRYPDEEPGQASKDYLADEFSAGVGLPAGQPWPALHLGAVSLKVAPLFEGRREKVICIHTGPSWAVREWPLATWDSFVAQIRQKTGCRVFQIGASRHFTEGKRLERPVEGVEDCRDRFSLIESLQIIARAQLVVGIDSGMIHGAVALKIPVIGLFGATSAVLRLPPRPEVAGLSGSVPCLGCHHRHPRLHWRTGCPYEIACMQTLDAREVVATAERLLSPGISSD